MHELSSKTLKLKNLTWKWPLLFLLIILLIGYGLANPPVKAAVLYPSYLSSSPAPTGIKGFYTAMEKNLQHVSIWNKPVQSLSEVHSNQLMIMVQPTTLMSESEQSAWIAWLEKGNSLLLAKKDPGDWFRVKSKDPSENPEDFGQHVKTLTGHQDLTGTYQAELNAAQRLMPEPYDQILIEDDIGVIALQRSFGKGRLIILLEPDWLTNERILRYDHLTLTLSLIQQPNPQVIWFNEYVHGYKNWLTVFETYPRWFIVLLIQSGIAVCFLLWSRAKRFGPSFLPRSLSVRFGDERIRALATWYERGNLHRESLRIQEQYLLQSIRETWKLTAQPDNELFYQSLSRRITPNKQAEWLKYWKEIRQIPDHISSKTHLLWSKRFAFMQKEVDRHE